ncbi:MULTISPECIES: ABC transporter ATP-binding protein [Pseudonocardia]|uniref:Multidrug ABC transporter ATP-binding protein n=2 Tax=Pseudonocardia TaxID=1847 RepID=A0ABQ0RS28_9PSEU|nr:MULTISPECIES: ABC transporter ATP-binding protein [Pseudonocardia]OSY39088.1 putative ABC transporter ATP-binding protein YxlF [Pseudonocardia autotrophica]TDN71316.1 ABC-2 type transport system ATP-binding protein [Pseudonocardia autotrophica]BBG01990.1 multidrug ABC transporter ATP-binding protein [Pseudonocardia autotrophica]GEC23154.1 multidrug ABC transporter ATP-binding protein [Pseudonocardia saturnea]
MNEAPASTTAVRPPPGPEEPAARVRDLRKVFGRLTAVDGIDLDVPAGSVFGMLGPNGSGKTTLIRMLLGLTRPTSGTVELLGRRVPDGLPAALPDVGALVEGPGFHPFLSGRENLRRVATLEPRLSAREIRPAVDAALDRVGLAGAAGRRYRGYSLGMKQRLGLAAALVVPRRLVVLDEPTNGLDPAGTREIRAVVADLRRSGVTVLLSSHLLSEVESVCTHVAVLKRGTLVASGELQRLLDAVAGGWEIGTTDVDGALRVLHGTGARARADDDGVVVGGVVVEDGPPAPELFAALVRAGIPVHGLRRQRPDLETLFTRITEGDS